MRIRLKDIIDLDYLISLDDALDSREDIQSRAIRDRKIYHECNLQSKTLKDLLFSWLVSRKKQFLQQEAKKEITLLPGKIFSSLYICMVYAVILSGSIAGISLVYSFLAYHGTRPINVAVFIALFVVFQVVLILFSLTLLVRKNKLRSSIIHTFISSLFFDFLPKILKKTKWTFFNKSLDTLEYTSSLIQMKSREYKNLFFWPFFILTSLFAFSFSAGALGGIFFRVVVSDMAFGWQSTLMATSTSIHDLVSIMALPWSWFVPDPLAFPSLEQIQGSRIILKDGISVLATTDLVSWWPFLCFSILFYAVIPRGILIVTGVLAQKQALKNFNFDRPRFRQLIIRMQSPVLDVDSNETQLTQTIKKNQDSFHDREIENASAFVPGPESLYQNAVILIARNIYSKEITKTLIQGINQHLYCKIKKMIPISFDIEKDLELIQQISRIEADQAILVQEVWQPPIRGLLHYITQVKASLPESMPLCILLTQDAGQKNLAVDKNDIDYAVWKKAILKLENPDILVKRFI